MSSGAASTEAPALAWHPTLLRSPCPHTVPPAKIPRDVQTEHRRRDGRFCPVAALDLQVGREGPAGGLLLVSSLDPATAADLVRRIVAGDGAAEAELVERCGRTLRFLCRRFTRTEADAEDLYQETLVLALEKIRGREVKEPERLAGFLRALAKNLSVAGYRRRRHSAEEPAEHLPEVADDGTPDALGGLLGQERKRLTRKLLEELNVPRDREILVRYYLAEEESSRICNDLGVETEHFYRVLSRARQRYRLLWEAKAQEAT